MLRRKYHEEQIELYTGEVKTVRVWELPAKKYDESASLKDFIELQKKIVKQTQEQEGFQLPKDPYDLLEAMTTKAYSDNLSKSEELWRIMTQEKDVSWIHNAPASCLEELENKFIEINLPLREAKKNADLMGRIIEILSPLLDSNQSSTTLPDDTEQPLSPFMLPGVIPK